jgi:hypothetical protein
MIGLLFIIFISIVIGEALNLAHIDMEVLPTGKEIDDWWWRWKIDNKYTLEDGQPLKCICCESDKLEWKVTNSINHEPCEREVYCSNCKELVGHWAYGNWEPM